MEIRLRLPAGHDTACHPGPRKTLHNTGLSPRAKKDCPPLLLKQKQKDECNNFLKMKIIYNIQQ